ncbi:MAG: DUF3800 domain-containing protein [Bacteroidota bacterium]|nr:DUF3800 domain-containing protein [Bacteroidota bacterium]
MSDTSKTYLFIDESGDHGLSKLNPDFPVFLLCGVLINDEEHLNADNALNQLKHAIWQNKQVIFHSRDIRKCEKEFQKLFDLEIKSNFYQNLNKIISETPYNIIASAILKQKFIENFGRLEDDVYQVALSFVVERAIMVLEELNPNTELEVVIEKRGKKEDKNLEAHFQRIVSRGTGLLTSNRINHFKTNFTFKDKKDNINGLQLADLVAYPIARNVIEPNRANPAFEVLESKIYKKGSELLGLKIFP